MSKVPDKLEPFTGSAKDYAKVWKVCYNLALQGEMPAVKLILENEPKPIKPEEAGRVQFVMQFISPEGTETSNN